jgi:hypothetical protein
MATLPTCSLVGRLLDHLFGRGAVLEPSDYNA